LGRETQPYEERLTDISEKVLEERRQRVVLVPLKVDSPPFPKLPSLQHNEAGLHRAKQVA
jgi:hypothetical protein